MCFFFTTNHVTAFFCLLLFLLLQEIMALIPDDMNNQKQPLAQIYFCCNLVLIVWFSVYEKKPTMQSLLSSNKHAFQY